MLNLFNLLFGKPEIKGEISLKIDESKEDLVTKVEGNIPTILVLISILSAKLNENKVPKELIKGAVDIGFNDTESLKDKKKGKVIEKEIIIDNKEKAERLKKLLEELEGK